MKIGVIGDDFTGSGDIANTLAKAGARTVQYVGIPQEPLPAETIDAAVIALKTRSIALTTRCRSRWRPCRWLVDNGAEQIVFKYCSTFDSTPQGPRALAVGAEIDTGVPVLISDGKPRLAFALKAGNFGGDDFFARAVEMLKGEL